jgi:hypothetical protein
MASSTENVNVPLKNTVAGSTAVLVFMFLLLSGPPYSCSTLSELHELSLIQSLSRMKTDSDESAMNLTGEAPIREEDLCQGYLPDPVRSTHETFVKSSGLRKWVWVTFLVEIHFRFWGLGLTFPLDSSFSERYAAQQDREATRR